MNAHTGKTTTLKWRSQPAQVSDQTRQGSVNEPSGGAEISWQQQLIGRCSTYQYMGDAISARKYRKISGINGPDSGDKAAVVDGPDYSFVRYPNQLRFRCSCSRYSARHMAPRHTTEPAKTTETTVTVSGNAKFPAWNSGAPFDQKIVRLCGAEACKPKPSLQPDLTT